MEPLTAYAEHLNHLPVDLRAEVILADMLEDGISLDELILNPIGGFQRAFCRDIHRVDWVESQQDNRKWLRIDLNRDGLYDLLPEGIFHQPTISDPQASKEVMLREMHIQTQREAAARRFFLPLEQEFLRQRIRVEQEERKYRFANSPFSLDDNLLIQFWGLPDFLTAAQIKRLLYLLPVLHQLVGDFDHMTACFEQLLEERVSLSLDPPAREAVGTQLETAPLGQWQLGKTALLGTRLIDEWPELCLTIHLSRAERLVEYLPGGVDRRVVDWLGEYLFPLETVLRLELDTTAIEDNFLLTDAIHTGRLDCTTLI